MFALLACFCQNIRNTNTTKNQHTRIGYCMDTGIRPDTPRYVFCPYQIIFRFKKKKKYPIHEGYLPILVGYGKLNTRRSPAANGLSYPSLFSVQMEWLINFLTSLLWFPSLPRSATARRVLASIGSQSTVETGQESSNAVQLLAASHIKIFTFCIFLLFNIYIETYPHTYVFQNLTYRGIPISRIRYVSTYLCFPDNMQQHI